MVEWYRLGFDDGALMDEVDSSARALLRARGASPPAERVTLSRSARARRRARSVYADARAELLRRCARRTRRPAARLAARPRRAAGPADGRAASDRTLGQRPHDVRHDYPASQAALARLAPGDPPSRPLRALVDGMELANGFHELADAPSSAAVSRRTATTRAVADCAVPPMRRATARALAARPARLRRRRARLRSRRDARDAARLASDDVLAFPVERA